MLTRRFTSTVSAALIACAAALPAQQSVEQKLAGFDAYMAKVLKDWNVPGIGVGVVIKDKLVFAKGYGYRDYGQRIPFTATTLMPIASNTKLFTSIAAGLLVEEGKLDWDKPIRNYVPTIKFYNDDLDRTVTIRDMLAHRTGITRHDLIWYKSDFNQKELFQRIQYLEPSEPLRNVLIYNNMMYVGAGYSIELLSGRTWEDYVRERILQPLGMTRTVFSIADMRKDPDHAVPYTERRDTAVLYKAPFYEEDRGIAAAGAMISSIQDMSRWLIAQMNGGKLEGKQVIPASVVRATLAPSIALPNVGLEQRGWGELINSYYGMGRWIASYRGRLLAYHGGDLPGFHSQVSMMPYDSIGVIVFVIGDHSAPLYNIVSYDLYERLLGLSLTPWSERQNTIRLRNREAAKAARTKAGGGRVAGTRPSHPIGDYVGEFSHPAYGVLTIAPASGAMLASSDAAAAELTFDFRGRIKLPLHHFHYDRFDTPDDEREGKWTVNFLTNPQGEIDRLEMSLDQSAVIFTRQVPAALRSETTLRQYVGIYESPAGAKVNVVIRPDGTLAIQNANGTFQNFIPWRPQRFRIKEFPEISFEFTIANGRVTELKQHSPTGVFAFARRN